MFKTISVCLLAGMLAGCVTRVEIPVSEACYFGPGDPTPESNYAAGLIQKTQPGYKIVNAPIGPDGDQLTISVPTPTAKTLCKSGQAATSIMPPSPPPNVASAGIATGSYPAYPYPQGYGFPAGQFYRPLPFGVGWAPAPVPVYGPPPPPRTTFVATGGDFDAGPGYESVQGPKGVCHDLRDSNGLVKGRKTVVATSGPWTSIPFDVECTPTQ